MRAELATLTRRFDAVTLAELEGAAQLQTRTDRKYFLDLSVLGQLAAALADEYRILDLDGRRLFDYHTVYFDTPTLTTYRQHQQGRRRRFKCRTRLYADSGLCFFEVKLKDGRGRTVKRKLALRGSEHGSLSVEARIFLADKLGGAYGCSAPAGLEPVLTTVYRRLTLVRREAEERVTCDVELAFSSPDGRRYGVLPGRVLVETKSERGRSFADRLLPRLGARPVGSCSKYCLGVALTRSDVVDNRLRPLLRRHFEVVPDAWGVAA